MLKKLFLLSGLVVSGSIVAQDRTWTKIDSYDGVIVYFCYADCELNIGYDERRVLLKMENTNNQPVNISWNVKLWINNSCYNCDDMTEAFQSIDLAPGDSKEGICERGVNDELYIFVEFIDRVTPQILTDFELSNVTVTF